MASTDTGWRATVSAPDGASAAMTVAVTGATMVLTGAIGGLTSCFANLWNELDIPLTAGGYGTPIVAHGATRANIGSTSSPRTFYGEAALLPGPPLPEVSSAAFARTDVWSAVTVRFSAPVDEASARAALAVTTSDGAPLAVAWTFAADGPSVAWAGVRTGTGYLADWDAAAGKQVRLDVATGVTDRLGNASTTGAHAVVTLKSLPDAQPAPFFDFTAQPSLAGLSTEGSVAAVPPNSGGPCGASGCVEIGPVMGGAGASATGVVATGTGRVVARLAISAATSLALRYRVATSATSYGFSGGLVEIALPGLGVVATNPLPIAPDMDATFTDATFDLPGAPLSQSIVVVVEPDLSRGESWLAGEACGIDPSDYAGQMSIFIEGLAAAP